MKNEIYIIKENEKLASSVYRMMLEGDISGIKAPGQFVNIRLDGHFLRRPISICDVRMDPSSKTAEGIITIIYKVLGRGTEEMTHLMPGAKLDVLTGLGNGYDLDDAGDSPLLIGGGVGIPPLYLTAKVLLKRGAIPHVILGYNSRDEIYYEEEFRALGCNVTVTTADGSTGIKGYVTDATEELSNAYTYFYTCGPLPMLKAVYDALYAKSGISGQLSFEERMGCGFGACMGCSVRTKDGSKRICKDGPVLRTEEIVWQSL